MAFDLNTVSVTDLIGIHGEREPKVCAVSGRNLVKPWITNNLGGKFYCRVLARQAGGWNDTRRAELLALIPKGAVSRPPVNRIPDNKEGEK